MDWTALIAWYRANGRSLPWRGSASAYEVTVSEFMLQQTQVDRVLPKFQAFTAQFPTWNRLAEADQAEVVRAWQGLGYNMRAVRLREMAKTVSEQFGGELPKDLETLLSIKGIGPYTARALRVFVHREPHLAPDTNVRRVLTRFFLGPRKNPAAVLEQVWMHWEATLPKGAAYDVNQALMDLGSSTCKAGPPSCEACPLKAACASYPGIMRLSRKRIPKQKPERNEKLDVNGVPDRIYRGKVIERLRRGPAGELELTRLVGGYTTYARIIKKLQKDSLIASVRGGGHVLR